MTHREELEQRDAELLSEIIGVVSSCRTHDALDAECDGLLAKIAAHRQDFALSERNAGWRDIETAPRDGTPILIYGGPDREPDEDCDCDIGRWATDFWGGLSWCMNAGDFWKNPTQWRPLPEPPATAIRSNQDAE